MPFDHTITIINNSGKVISTGKHLVGLFKEAKSAYREKKSALKQEKAGGLRHANTFHGPSGGFGKTPFIQEFEDSVDLDDREHGYRSLGNTRQPLFLEGSGRRSQDDSSRHSRAPSESQNSRRPHRSSSVGGGSSHHHHSKSRHGRERPSHDGPRPARPPLTARNLRTHSEVSSTAPSTLPARPRRDDGVSSSEHASRRLLSAAAQPDTEPRALVRAQTTPAAPETLSTTPAPTPRMSMMVSRPKSDPALRAPVPEQPIDMNLAYGDMPPDLDSRFDLDSPVTDGEEQKEQKEARVKTLIDYIESLLDEAQCIHHTASSIIAHLQDSPEAAAAVALTLAELSALLAKLSPVFLGIVKGGSPAVFALLASPQFLIGTSIAVGITVVAFGGWKIVKRITDGKQAFEVGGSAQEQHQYKPPAGPALAGVRLQSLPPAVGSTAPSVVSDGFDEALVLEEELSSIESWRRGIVAPSDYEDGSGDLQRGSEVDAELISPEAMRSRIGDDDARTLRSVRTHLTSRSSRADTNSLQSSHSHHHSKRHQDRGHGSAGTGEAGKSSRGFAAGDSSVVSSRRSRRSEHHTGERAKSGSTVPASSASPSSPPSDLGTQRSKDKKESSSSNMLKQLFKKRRNKEDKNRDDTYVSVLT